jgi:hypothetical protein
MQVGDAVIVTKHEKHKSITCVIKSMTGSKLMLRAGGRFGFDIEIEKRFVKLIKEENQ